MVVHQIPQALLVLPKIKLVLLVLMVELIQLHHIWIKNNFKWVMLKLPKTVALMQVIKRSVMLKMQRTIPMQSLINSLNKSNKKPTVPYKASLFVMKKVRNLRLVTCILMVIPQIPLRPSPLQVKTASVSAMT